MVTIGRRLLANLAICMGLVGAVPAVTAQPEETGGRVGRLSQVEGKVWFFDQEQDQWGEGLRNQVLTGGDRLSTERGARAEVRIGSTELRLDGNTELEFERMDDDRMVFRLANGSVALRVRSRELAREAEIHTEEARIVPERAGHYRVDREDEVTSAAAWRGALRADTRDQRVEVVAGRRAEFYREGRDGATAVSWSAPEKDRFADWVARDEQREERQASQQYVSPEMTGVEDLDRYGRWDRHPDYGMVWVPVSVAADWAPYRQGRWMWRARWGWTWVDEAPWGFAPFHYGRWVYWGNRWAWSPGAYVARPVFAPALVAWVGGPQASFSISVGGYSGPAVGWVPLAPYDVYVPPFAYSPRYYERVNRPHHGGRTPQVPTGPIMYGNKGVPGAVTVVPSNVLAQRQPVAPQVVRERDVERVIGRETFRHDNPVAVPARPATPRVVAVPGGAEPVRIPPPPGREAAEPRRPFIERRDREGARDGDRERERVSPAAAPRAVPQVAAPPRPATPAVPTQAAPTVAAPPVAVPQVVAPARPSGREERDAGREPRGREPNAAPSRDDRGNAREREQRSEQQRPPQHDGGRSQAREHSAEPRQNQRERQNQV